MNTKLMALFVAASLTVMPVMAEKPAWAGKGQPSVEQKEKHKSAMEAKDSDRDGKEFRVKEREEKKEKSTDSESMEKQREMKSKQVQKELGKGSEKGQESRENSRKWWRFWEE